MLHDYEYFCKYELVFRKHVKPVVLQKILVFPSNDNSLLLYTFIRHEFFKVLKCFVCNLSNGFVGIKCNVTTQDHVVHARQFFYVRMALESFCCIILKNVCFFSLKYIKKNPENFSRFQTIYKVF